MSSRLVRFKLRKAIRNSFNEKSHLKELSNSDSVKILLAQDVDSGFIEATFDKGKTYDLDVSEIEVSESLVLLDNQFTKEKYNVLFDTSKEVLIDQLLSPFKLSRSDLTSVDRDFEYSRENYTKSPKSAGGEGDSFATAREKYKEEVLTDDGKIKDTYTGEYHDASDMDLDHIKSLNEFHTDGGFMLSETEKRQFAADSDNHEYTHKSINRSKSEKNIREYSETNREVDKRRTNAAHERSEKAAEKYVPRGRVDKTVWVAKEGAKDGLETGGKQGVQQAIGVFLSEFISAIFSEVKDVFSNGWKNGKYDLSWIDIVKERLKTISARLLGKWKKLVASFAQGALSGFVSAISTALINMFIRTGKNIVRLIREGFMSLTKAIKMLLLPPEGTTLKQAAHEASKILATGFVITGGILAGEAIATLLNGIPFSGIISTVIAGLISGLGSLLVVFMLDKFDIFGVNEDERHQFIMGNLEPRISLNIEKIKTIVERLDLKYAEFKFQVQHPELKK